MSVSVCVCLRACVYARMCDVSGVLKDGSGCLRVIDYMCVYVCMRACVSACVCVAYLSY